MNETKTFTQIDNRLADVADCMALPVESPVSVFYDDLNGDVYVESAVFQPGGKPRQFLLRLRFTSEAACELIHLLRAADEKYDISLAHDPLSARPH